MERARLETILGDRYDADARTVRVVARQAGDLADSGRIEADLGFELTPERLLAQLDDAPDGSALLDRWNWWMGALELSHGGYEQFRVRPDAV